MLIKVNFNNDKITATTETILDGKISARVHRDYGLNAAENANKAVEKLIDKTEEFEPLQDIEFAIHSTDKGYIYISLTGGYTTAYVTNGIKEVN